MPIHLHIGTHKTGTTAFQRQLQRSREALKQRGIWYPNEAELLPGRGARIPHRNIARSLHSGSAPKPYSADELLTIAKALLRGSRDYEHTIISSEAFWRIGFPGTPDHHTSEELWLRKQANVNKIRTFFGDADVRIAAVLRERSAYIQSGYSEFILATLYQKGIKSFIRTYSYSWDYLRQLQTWGSLFPVSAHSYEKLCQHNRLPLDLLRSICGADLPDDTLVPDPKPWVNISQPLACVAFKRFLNQLPLTHDKRSKLHCKYRKIFKKAAHKPVVQQFLEINSWLNAEELTDLRCALASGDEQIRCQLCPSLVSQPTGWWARLQPGQAEPRAMTDADRMQVIDWMLKRKPVKQGWFHPVDPQG
ncbi:MAG: hypothetical protein WBN89_16545 [Prochlorococcaceae cyanobacterium]